LTRFVLRLIPMLLLSCLSLSLVARAIGTTQPPNPALRGFVEGCKDKPQPCWYGLVPGVTSEKEAVELMVKANYTPKLTLSPSSDFFRDTCLDSGIPACYVSDNLVPGYVELIWDRCGELGDCTEKMEIYGVSGSFGDYEVRLGDLIVATELPVYIRHMCGWMHLEYQSATSLGIAYHRDGSFIFYCPSMQRISPMYPIRRLELRLLMDDSTNDIDYSWHGFIPRWRYCKLKPELAQC
jgi:hypothetical protein